MTRCERRVLKFLIVALDEEMIALMTMAKVIIAMKCIIMLINMRLTVRVKMIQWMLLRTTMISIVFSCKGFASFRC